MQLPAAIGGIAAGGHDQAKGVQQTADVVAAMEPGTAEVESGTAQAANAGQALQDILAVDNVAAVTEENTAATARMAVSSDEVGRSVLKLFTRFGTLVVMKEA